MYVVSPRSAGASYIVLHLSFETQAAGMLEGAGRGGGGTCPSPPSPDFCRLVDHTYLNRDADCVHQLMHAPSSRFSELPTYLKLRVQCKIQYKK